MDAARNLDELDDILKETNGMPSIRFERLYEKGHIRFWIDNQGFELAYDCSPEGGMTMSDKMDWIEKQLTIALNKIAKGL